MKALQISSVVIGRLLFGCLDEETRSLRSEKFPAETECAQLPSVTLPVPISRELDGVSPKLTTGTSTVSNQGKFKISTVGISFIIVDDHAVELVNPSVKRPSKPRELSPA
jgi:hypothetical protein